VRLWFGRHPIADYIGAPASAARHEAAMRRRFPDLEITNHPLRPADHSPADMSQQSLRFGIPSAELLVDRIAQDQHSTAVECISTGCVCG
jgi:hypothetical protein